MTSIKNKIFHILEEADNRHSSSWYFDIFLTTVILLNVLAVIFETVQEIYVPYKIVFEVFEIFSITLFTLEYFLRVWTITAVPKYSHPVKGRLKFIFSLIGIFDLLAFLPFYLPFFGMDLRFVRMLRLLRLLRLLKLTRYLGTLTFISNVIRHKALELTVSLVFLILILIFTSTFMYFIENQAQPDQFSSIPATMWWGVAALTTVGYGDMYPVTTLGRVLGAMISILGIGFFALPAGILASGFATELKKVKKGNKSNDKE